MGIPEWPDWGETSLFEFVSSTSFPPSVSGVGWGGAADMKREGGREDGQKVMFFFFCIIHAFKVSKFNHVSFCCFDQFKPLSVKSYDT